MLPIIFQTRKGSADKRFGACNSGIQLDTPSKLKPLKSGRV